MRIILFLLSALAFLAGGGILKGAQSAIHEIEAFMLFLVSAVLFVGASIVETINVARKKIENTLRERPAPAVSHETNYSVDPVQHLIVPPQHPPQTESLPTGPPAFPMEGSEQANERDASDLLEQARRFAHSGARDKAVGSLRDVVRRFPKTKAAEKARRSLKKADLSREIEP